MKASQPAPILRALAFAQGFSMRKLGLLRAFTGRSDIRAQSPGEPVPAGADLLVWGADPAVADVRADVRVIRVEDGFIRSVGLGADLTRPVSWVFDDVGIYFDARRPSRLENLLQETEFKAEELERARRLRHLLVRHGLTKYNLPARAWRPANGGKRIVLVAGQVETDASIAQGATGVNTNMDLLAAVRRARPDAWVVYKPHPDVVAGLRRVGALEEFARHRCDEIVTEGAMDQLIEIADEVHVMTSLTGFEALLRGKPVWCYGHPFYAGYGLTQDAQPHPRRSRRLRLDELVAAALIRYPSYLSPSTGDHCTPEQAIDELVAWRDRTGGALPVWRQWLRPFLARP